MTSVPILRRSSMSIVEGCWPFETCFDEGVSPLADSLQKRNISMSQWNVNVVSKCAPRSSGPTSAQ